MLHAVRAALRDETGQGLVEYGLVILLVSTAAFGVLTLLSGTIVGLYANVASLIP